MTEKKCLMNCINNLHIVIVVVMAVPFCCSVSILTTRGIVFDVHLYNQWHAIIADWTRSIHEGEMKMTYLVTHRWDSIQEIMENKNANMKKIKPKRSCLSLQKKIKKPEKKCH